MFVGRILKYLGERKYLAEGRYVRQKTRERAAQRQKIIDNLGCASRALNASKNEERIGELRRRMNQWQAEAASEIKRGRNLGS
jgi:hypothetical protein